MNEFNSTQENFKTDFNQKDCIPGNNIESLFYYPPPPTAYASPDYYSTPPPCTPLDVETYNTKPILDSSSNSIDCPCIQLPFGPILTPPSRSNCGCCAGKGPLTCLTQNGWTGRPPTAVMSNCGSNNTPQPLVDILNNPTPASFNNCNFYCSGISELPPFDRYCTPIKVSKSTQNDYSEYENFSNEQLYFENKDIQKPMLHVRRSKVSVGRNIFKCSKVKPHNLSLSADTAGDGTVLNNAAKTQKITGIAKNTHYLYASLNCNSDGNNNPSMKVNEHGKRESTILRLGNNNINSNTTGITVDQPLLDFDNDSSEEYNDENIPSTFIYDNVVNTFSTVPCVWASTVTNTSEIAQPHSSSSCLEINETSTEINSYRSATITKLPTTFNSTLNSLVKKSSSNQNDCAAANWDGQESTLSATYLELNTEGTLHESENYEMKETDTTEQQSNGDNEPDYPPDRFNYMCEPNDGDTTTYAINTNSSCFGADQVRRNVIELTRHNDVQLENRNTKTTNFHPHNANTYQMKPFPNIYPNHVMADQGDFGDENGSELNGEFLIKYCAGEKNKDCAPKKIKSGIGIRKFRYPLYSHSMKYRRRMKYGYHSKNKSTFVSHYSENVCQSSEDSDPSGSSEFDKWNMDSWCSGQEFIVLTSEQSKNVGKKVTMQVIKEPVKNLDGFNDPEPTISTAGEIHEESERVERATDMRFPNATRYCMPPRMQNIRTCVRPFRPRCWRQPNRYRTHCCQKPCCCYQQVNSLLPCSCIRNPPCNPRMPFFQSRTYRVNTGCAQQQQPYCGQRQCCIPCPGKEICLFKCTPSCHRTGCSPGMPPPVLPVPAPPYCSPYIGTIMPPRRYESPPRRNDSPPRRYESPPRRYESPPRRYESPPRRYESPPRRYESPPRRYKSPPRRSESPPRRSESPPRRSKSPPRRYEPPPRRYESPPPTEKPSTFSVKIYSELSLSQPSLDQVVSPPRETPDSQKIKPPVKISSTTPLTSKNTGNDTRAKKTDPKETPDPQTIIPPVNRGGTTPLTSKNTGNDVRAKKTDPTEIPDPQTIIPPVKMGGTTPSTSKNTGNDVPAKKIDSVGTPLDQPENVQYPVTPARSIFFDTPSSLHFFYPSLPCTDACTTTLLCPSPNPCSPCIYSCKGTDAPHICKTKTKFVIDKEIQVCTDSATCKNKLPRKCKGNFCSPLYKQSRNLKSSIHSSSKACGNHLDCFKIINYLADMYAQAQVCPGPSCPVSGGMNCFPQDFPSNFCEPALVHQVAMTPEWMSQQQSNPFPFNPSTTEPVLLNYLQPQNPTFTEPAPNMNQQSELRYRAQPPTSEFQPPFDQMQLHQNLSPHHPTQHFRPFLHSKSQSKPGNDCSELSALLARKILANVFQKAKICIPPTTPQQCGNMDDAEGMRGSEKEGKPFRYYYPVIKGRGICPCPPCSSKTCLRTCHKEHPHPREQNIIAPVELKRCCAPSACRPSCVRNLNPSVYCFPIISTQEYRRYSN